MSGSAIIAQYGVYNVFQCFSVELLYVPEIALIQLQENDPVKLVGWGGPLPTNAI